MFNVMIVDDMDFVRRDIKRLRLWGEETDFYISEEARNGSEALSMLDVNPVDLVITDVRMPKIDGIELLRKIMDRKICPCVVLLSDYDDFDYVRQGLVLGAFDYLKKPVNEEEFKDLLCRVKRSILEKRKEQERVRKLEEKLGEKVEVYFPKVDVHQIIEFIQEGEIKAVEAAGRIVDITWANLDNDLMKTESVLKNVIHEVVSAIWQKNTWIDKFADINELGNADFSNCNTLESLKTVFTGVVNKVLILLNTLVCRKARKGIVGQICNFVLENVDSKVSLSVVAEKLFMNKTYISETFKQRTGIPFVEYLKTIKMERAKRLLSEGKLKTYEVGEILGYKDIEYFSKLFKEQTGLTPTEFRQVNTIKDK